MKNNGNNNQRNENNRKWRRKMANQRRQWRMASNGAGEKLSISVISSSRISWQHGGGANNRWLAAAKSGVSKWQWRGESVAEKRKRKLMALAWKCWKRGVALSHGVSKWRLSALCFQPENEKLWKCSNGEKMKIHLAAQWNMSAGWKLSMA